MNYLNSPPVQMNINTAAQYCCVSVNKFIKDYRPELTEYKDGGNAYFLTSEINRLIQKRFQEQATWASQKKTKEKVSIKPTKPKTHSKKADPFAIALQEVGL